MMPDIFDVVKVLYPNVITIYVNSPTKIEALDAGGNPVTIDCAAVNSEVINLDQDYKIQQVKDNAKILLAETDYTEIPSVTNPTSKLYLTNGSEFVVYRDAIRAIAVNPTIDAVFPPKPVAQWSS
jgi:hypothetical protein